MIPNEKVSKKIKMLENLKSFQSLEHLKDKPLTTIYL